MTVAVIVLVKVSPGVTVVVTAAEGSPMHEQTESITAASSDRRAAKTAAAFGSGVGVGTLLEEVSIVV